MFSDHLVNLAQFLTFNSFCPLEKTRLNSIATLQVTVIPLEHLECVLEHLVHMSGMRYVYV